MRKFLSLMLVIILTTGLFTIPISATEDEELKEIFEVMYRCEALISYFQIDTSDLHLLNVSYSSDYVFHIEDTSIIPGIYIKANDTWTYEGLKAEMLEVMTKEMTLAHLSSAIIKINGEYYVHEGGGISTAEYSSRFKRIIERTEDTVKIGVYDDPWDEDNWTEYEYIVLKKIDGSWKVVYYDLNDEDVILRSYPYFSEEYLSYRKERLDPDKRAERTTIAAEEGKKFKQGIKEIPETSDGNTEIYYLFSTSTIMVVVYTIVKTNKEKKYE